MPLSKITNPFLDSAGSARSNVYSPSANTIAITTATAERLRVDSSGNVGINTTSPNAKLEIKAASASQRQLQLTHFNSTDGWYFTADDTGGVLKTSRAGGSGLNGEAMRIDSAGVVQVGNNAGTGEVFAQNTVKAWGVVKSDGTLYNSFGISSISKISTGIFAISFTRTFASGRFGFGGSQYSSGFVFANTESTTGCRINTATYLSVATDADAMFVISGSS